MEFGMSNIQTLELEAQEARINFRVRLMRQENPDVVERVLESLPLDSLAGHVVVSGEAIWLPTRIVHLGRSHMVKRSPGAVYLYAPGQTICLTYGAITEAALVNKFGQVFEEDMEALKTLGQFVWQKTVADPRKEVVKVSIRSVA
jgi:hypothetical protein